MEPTSSLLTNFIKNLVFLVKVEGESGWPELIPGKLYLATNLIKPRVDDFIVFQNPDNQKEFFIKKIKEIKDNSYFVEGILPWAKSSKDFGPINKKLFFGKIIFKGK
jgi:phage repressor protein C with HTH and peptisase S24 domain